MKVCNRCGDSISTRDGDNRCQACKSKPASKAKKQRETRDDIMRSLGMVKVRGAMGGTYWE